MEQKEVEKMIGLRCRVSGDLANGWNKDGTPYICHEDVVRVVRRIDGDRVVLECGRRFIINKNLKITVQ